MQIPTAISLDDEGCKTAAQPDEMTRLARFIGYGADRLDLKL